MNLSSVKGGIINFPLFLIEENAKLLMTAKAGCAGGIFQHYVLVPYAGFIYWLHMLVSYAGFICSFIYLLHTLASYTCCTCRLHMLP